MNKLKSFLLILLIATSLILTGCWDAHELNTLSIVSGIGIDRGESEDEFNVTVQIGKSEQKSQNGGSEGGENFLMLGSSEKTVSLALDRIRFMNNRQLFLHHNEVIIISKEQAKRGVEPVLDIFLRDHETRLETWVIISEYTAKDLLKVKLIQEPVTAVGIARMMKEECDKSVYLATNMLDLLSRLIDKGTSSVIPIMDTIEEDEKTQLIITGTALFKNDKMVGRLNNEETLGFIIAMGNVKGTMLDVPLDDGIAALGVDNVTSKMTPKLTDNGVSVRFEVESELHIEELKGFKNTSMADLFPQLERAAKERISSLIENTFEKTQQYKADIYGVGLSLYRNHPKEWKTMEDSWGDIYADTTLDVTAKATIKNTGKIADSISMLGEK